MGAIYCSIPTELADSLRIEFGLTAFVETGLGQGTSALWAERHFAQVVSIESDGELVTKFKSKHQRSRVIVIEGDSGIQLAEAIKELNGPALFWLDAHTDNGTPILSELAAINANPASHVIMIDDARMFGAGAWPTIERVISAAMSGRHMLAMEIDDVLVITP